MIQSIRPSTLQIESKTWKSRLFEVIKFTKFGNFSEKHGTSVSFGPESFTNTTLPRDEAVRLAIGYSTGELEMYSIRYEHEGDCFKAQLVAVSPIYNARDGKPSVVNRLGWSRRWNMLFAGTDDGRVVHFEHVHLEKSRKPRY